MVPVEFHLYATILCTISSLTQLSLAQGPAKKDLAAGTQLLIVEGPRSISLSPGATAELTCEAFGTPVPAIQWLHNGKAMRTGLPPDNFSPVLAERLSNRGTKTFQMATTSSKLRINCADASKAGVYSCLASNGVETVSSNATVRFVEKANELSQGDHCLRKRSHLPVDRAPALIYMWTDSRMERPGVSVQLMCRASGNPKPKIIWYQNSDDGGTEERLPITSDDERYLLLPNGDLLVKKSPEDVPLSVFQCEAVNESGKDRVTTMLLQIIDDTTKKEQDEQEFDALRR